MPAKARHSLASYMQLDASTLTQLFHFPLRVEIGTIVPWVNSTSESLKPCRHRQEVDSTTFARLIRLLAVSLREAPNWGDDERICASCAVTQN